MVIGTTTAIYTIPSLALFSLLVPVTGLGPVTVVLGLGLYSLTILVRNILDGLRRRARRRARVGHRHGVRPPRGCCSGSSSRWPCPTIMAGLRVATVSAVALTTVGAILDYGGLGNLLIAGEAERLQGAGPGHQRALRAARGRRSTSPRRVQRVLTPWTRKAATA